MLTVVLIFIASLFFIGIRNKTRSLVDGRKGSGILQPVYDVLRLANDQSSYNVTSSFIFKIAPSIYFSSILMAICFIPFGSHGPLLSFKGDFVFFAYTLALGKFFMILSTLDAGNGFENRKTLFSMLVEPAFFLLMASFALFTDYSSFNDIYNHIHFSSDFSWVPVTMAAFILVLISMVENRTFPVGNPAKLMSLDNSGFDLAMIFYGTALKFAMCGMLICNFFLTSSMSFLAQTGIYLLVQVLWAMTAGLLESFQAKKQMKKNALFIFLLMALSIVIFFGMLLWQQKFN